MDRLRAAVAALVIAGYAALGVDSWRHRGPLSRRNRAGPLDRFLGTFLVLAAGSALAAAAPFFDPPGLGRPRA